MEFHWTSREKKLAGCLAFVTLMLISSILYSSFHAKQEENEILLPSYPIEENEQKAEEKMLEAVKSEPKKIWVDVKGAVHRPGVYELAENARLYQVLELAGGLLPDAESRAVNQAKRLVDGEMIYIPKQGEEDKQQWEQMLTSTSHNNQSSKENTININQAPPEELTRLPGIGEAKAAAIVAYRAEHGPFQKKEEIMDVSGIGEKTFEQMKDQISLE